MGMDKFNSGDHYIYHCEQFLRRNGVTFIFIKSEMQFLGTISKITKCSVYFQAKPFNVTVIQVYSPTINAEETEFEQFYEDLQDLLVSVQSLSYVLLSVTPWPAAHQATLSITHSWSLLKFMSIKLVMASNHLILWHPLVFLPSVSIRVFSKESVHHIRWPKYWSFSFSISPSNEYSGPFSLRID